VDPDRSSFSVGRWNGTDGALGGKHWKCNRFKLFDVTLIDFTYVFAMFLFLTSAALYDASLGSRKVIDKFRDISSSAPYPYHLSFYSGSC
jgi:hypothetical protein